MRLIGERYGVDLSEVPLVGDSLRDLQAGAAAGCQTHMVRTGNGGLLDDAQLAALLQQVPGTQVHDDLGAFADWLIHNERRLRGLPGESDSGYGELG
jgi:D-glycero-D-manno-heptose 1,7-bisphosphate phosphatase